MFPKGGEEKLAIKYIYLYGSLNFNGDNSGGQPVIKIDLVINQIRIMHLIHYGGCCNYKNRNRANFIIKMNVPACPYSIFSNCLNEIYMCFLQYFVGCS